eukprot:GHVR01033896.1.p1 GENE.GHVR01033896.1~~GHVR01033896.1.p1  ORF type:complete len:289 (+),score=25.48 GHVR01033896.1:411-1277(+)
MCEYNFNRRFKKDGIVCLLMDNIHSVAEITLLIEEGAYINCVSKDGVTPLSWACERGYRDLAQLLIDHGALIDSRVNVHMMNVHCDNGYNTSSKDKDGIVCLVMDNIHPVEEITLLIETGACVNSFSKDGKSPLYSAAERGDIAVMKSLKGADANVADNVGKTPLFWASFKGYVEVVKCLIDKGADVNVRDNDGDTPLSLACQRGRRDLAQLLIDHGALIDSRDNEGNSPLIWVAYNGHLEIVKCLINKGADVNRADNRGRSPLSWALQGDNQKVIDYLKLKGARKIL